MEAAFLPRPLLSHTRPRMLIRTILCLLAASQCGVLAADARDVLSACEAYRYRDAVELARKMATPAPEARHAWGVALGKLGRWEEAVEELERAAEAKPQDVEVLIDLANAQVQRALEAGPLGKFTGARKARATLERAVTLAPGNLDARYGLFGYYLNAPGIVGGDREKALAQLREMERLDPALAPLARADLALAEKDWDGAFRHYREVQVRRPDDFRAFYGFGRVAALSGLRLEEGLESLRRCLALAAPLRTPRIPGVHLRIGDILKQRGDIPGARAAYLESLRVDPEYRFAKEALAVLASK